VLVRIDDLTPREKNGAQIDDITLLVGWERSGAQSGYDDLPLLEALSVTILPPK
jgi:hypothetical protein